ncbi:Ig-like domain-containing protein [Mycobacterium sp. 21AC1]|uniref:L,D-transpeptidase n=1 Tax=[Mycobacterium] appelbergii TaxID=2939269 RepID=UPI002938D76C|nr:Ig-like domain-containing protein [Mycobacterium sp. 21AC1]MDV3127621.1 Ig-like domain-containing protein [Mycobacterium sp. 21AC1]
MIAVAAVWLSTRSATGGPQARADVQRPEAAPAAVSFAPTADSTAVNPAGPVRVTASQGSLVDVTMVDDANVTVPGAMTPDKLTWTPRGALEYGRTYSVNASSRGLTGIPATQTSTFTTLAPRNQTRVSFTTTSKAPLVEGATYGVGTVIVAHFDEPVTDRAAAQKRLSVKTTPEVEGSWFWMDNQNAHWRPAHYYRPGTQIVAEADIYGADLGAGLYGEKDTHTAFRIGDSHVSVADDATKQISVYRNGELIRTIPTSMGMGGSETVGGQAISFWTQPGVYTVMDKANPVIMDSSTYGLPVDSRLGYKLKVNYAVRLTNSGIYVHQLDSTVWAQGNTNTSHGCLNVNADNARWFYEFSQPGDVFEVRNTGGQPLPIWQNGDWSVPWDQWLAGSALPSAK